MKPIAITAMLAALVAAPAMAESITPVAEAQRGTTVTMRGTVERINDEDEFRLVDASGRIQVYVGPNLVPAIVGESVTVEGFVDDDPGPRELYARRLTRADGSVVEFKHRYD